MAQQFPVLINSRHLFRYVLLEGRTGWVSGTVIKYKKERITDHGYKKFVFPNHENKEVTLFGGLVLKSHNGVVKSQILVNNLSSSQVTQNLQITYRKE